MLPREQWESHTGIQRPRLGSFSKVRNWNTDSHLSTSRLSLYSAHGNSYPVAIFHPTKVCASLKSSWRSSFHNSRVFEYSVPSTVVVVLVALCCSVSKSCPTLCDPVDCSPPGCSVHGISQARILEWVAISFSGGSSQPMDRTQVSCLAGRFFTTKPPGKPRYFSTLIQILRFSQTISFLPFSSELRSHPTILTHAYTKAECKISKNMRSRGKKWWSRF